MKNQMLDSDGIQSIASRLNPIVKFLAPYEYFELNVILLCKFETIEIR